MRALPPFPFSPFALPSHPPRARYTYPIALSVSINISHPKSYLSEQVWMDGKQGGDFSYGASSLVQKRWAQAAAKKAVDEAAYTQREVTKRLNREKKKAAEEEAKRVAAAAAEEEAKRKAATPAEAAAPVAATPAEVAAPVAATPAEAAAPICSKRTPPTSHREGFFPANKHKRKPLDRIPRRKVHCPHFVHHCEPPISLSFQLPQQPL